MVNGSFLQHLEHPTELLHLDISEDEITDDNFRHITRFTNLQSLILRGNRSLTGSGIAHLYTLRNLRQIILYRVSRGNIRIEHIQALQEALPELDIKI
jgi:hypothetical protein